MPTALKRRDMYLIFSLAVAQFPGNRYIPSAGIMTKKKDERFIIRGYGPLVLMRSVPPILFLRLVKEKGGMPLTVTGDKGSELGILISLVMMMRKFQPFLPEDQLPAFRAVKSTFNITCERGWRPIWEKELLNIHKQKGILLPSGASRIDLYSKPVKFGGEDRLIKTDYDIIDDLLDEYNGPDLLLFGTPEAVALCRKIYIGIGEPKLSARIGWHVFAQMIEYYIQELASTI
ncbi:hypothetical protein BDQ17DRAFT_1522641 [Cyathus striatus]|nr:hypothetical protein BDQ17DRAFT_1522641 [Cyathus striatus]